MCSNNLKLLSIAMHDYYEEHGSFPPAYLPDEYGNPTHSWRVLILPYLEQTELYKKYDFGEPWNSPKNIQLVDQMPEAYHCPMDKEDTPSGYTHYVAVVGEATIWPNERGLAFKDIMDGSSNTYFSWNPTMPSRALCTNSNCFAVQVLWIRGGIDTRQHYDQQASARNHRNYSRGIGRQ